MQHILPPRFLASAALALLLAASPAVAQPTAASAPPPGTITSPDESCPTQMQAIAKRASALVRRVEEHNRFALDHAEKYKRELETCELAKRANSRPQLEACLALLDRADKRAETGNRAAEVIAKETAALKGSSTAHNKSCPSHQVYVVQ